MSPYVRSRISLVLVIAALAGWYLVDQVTDWSQNTMIGGVVVIALACPFLGRWIG